MEEILKKIVEIELEKINTLNLNSLLINNIYKLEPQDIFTEYLIFSFCKDIDENPHYFILSTKITEQDFAEKIEKINLNKIMTTLLIQDEDWVIPVKKLKRLTDFAGQFQILKENVKL